MQKSAAALWSEYRDDTVVRRAEHYAKYTVPSLMVDPLEGDSPETICHDYQSLGSLLLNNLASKLVALLFPSNQPFFKNVMTDELKAQAAAKGVPADTLASKLSLLEQEATKNLFVGASYAKLTLAVKRIIATGQVLIYRDTDAQKFRVWSLQNFVVKRDAYGDWQCIVLKQRFLFGDLPPEIQADLAAKRPGSFKPETKLDLYTKILREKALANDIVRVFNEVDGRIVGPHSQYPIHLSPWILPVWNLADGEDYARGYVEEYAGDFSKLSVLSEQLALYELDSLEIINMVDSTSGSSIDDFKSANSGDYIPGKEGDVTAFEKGDYQKIQATQASLRAIETRLSIAFMYTGNTRDAERVTAEEIKAQAKEAENMLGGAYSILAETLQNPLAYLMMQEVSTSVIPGLISRTFFPQIITGIPALNRNIEIQNLLGAIQEGAATVPLLAQVDPRLDPVKVMDMIYRNRAVDTDTVFKSSEDMQAEANAAEAQANAMAQAVPTLDTQNLNQIL